MYTNAEHLGSGPVRILNEPSGQVMEATWESRSRVAFSGLRGVSLATGNWCGDTATQETTVSNKDTTTLHFDIVASMGPNVNDSAIYVPKFALWVLNGDIRTNADIGEVYSGHECCRTLPFSPDNLLPVAQPPQQCVAICRTMSQDHVLYGVAIQFLRRRETILAGGCVAVLQESMA